MNWESKANRKYVYGIIIFLESSSDRMFRINEGTLEEHSKTRKVSPKKTSFPLRRRQKSTCVWRAHRGSMRTRNPVKYSARVDSHSQCFFYLEGEKAVIIFASLQPICLLCLFQEMSSDIPLRWNLAPQLQFSFLTRKW